MDATDNIMDDHDCKMNLKLTSADFQVQKAHFSTLACDECVDEIAALIDKNYGAHEAFIR